jgi:hypothetical protein
MLSSTMKKSLGFVLSTLVALTVAGASFAADSTPAQDALDASRKIDRDLQATANQFNRELNQSYNQFQEANRLGTSPNTANRFGTQSGIDKEISSTVDRANDELRTAQKRDDYTERRRELETTRSLYYPGSKEYDHFSDQINKLDRDFSDNALSSRW